jgi:hypothetical protein
LAPFIETLTMPPPTLAFNTDLLHLSLQLRLQSLVACFIIS